MTCSTSGVSAGAPSASTGSTTDLTDLARVVAADIDMGGRRVEVDPTPATATVDPRMVERILHNLMANAARHTPPDATSGSRAGWAPTRPTIEVADDGPGIDPR